MSKGVMLTGIKPTGHPHVGNYIGAIKPAIELSKGREGQALYFIADYHALNAVQDPEKFRGYTKEVAATWLALGLDEDVIFYRQTEVPEILELAYILSCLTPKGLMNRAHAYKAKVDANTEAGVDVDTGVNMGLYTYPILMAADILLFQSNYVPVGKDQIQHIEIALFERPEKLKKLINKIKTDSSLPTDPKEPETLFMLYKEFATEEEIRVMREKYETGIGWGDVKKELFQVMNRELEEPRKKYDLYMQNPHLLYEALQKGANRAREIARFNLAEIKKRIGYETI